MKLPKKSLERKLFKSGYRYVIGVDEVGMGCLAGPVVVCAVAMTATFYNKTHKNLRWLRESKLLQARQREEYAKQLMAEKDIKFQVTYAYPKTIDKLNIYNAARLAMKKSVNKLTKGWHDWGPHGHGNSLSTHGVRSDRTPSSKAIILVDGKTEINGLKIKQIPIVKGDRKIFAIACASIIAKVFRDKMMVRYARKYPGYGFEKHKGYGTKYHQAQLAALGPCEIHRKSFAPVAKLL